MKRFKTSLLLTAAVFFIEQAAPAQCTVSSSCGYNINVRISPIDIISGSSDCTYGYNYNVRFGYQITVSGTNNCYNGSIGLQPLIDCSGQNNGYYTINVNAPNVGDPSASVAYSGTLTTSTNPYRNTSDCNTATPASLSCNGLQVTIYGPGISSNTYPCSFAVLPIELVEFKGRFDKNKIVLSWITASETNNSYFTPERSANGETWQSLGKVPGKGTTTQRSSYELPDYDYDNGLNYYRLKQTDADGAYHYSGIIAVNSSSNNHAVQLQSPFNETLSVTNNSGQLCHLQLLDTYGRVLYDTYNSSNDINISTQQAAAGLYFLKVNDGQNEYCLKALKQP